VKVAPFGFTAVLYPTFTPEKNQAAQVEVPGKAGGLSSLIEVREVTTLRYTRGGEMNSELGCWSV